MQRKAMLMSGKTQYLKYFSSKSDNESIISNWNNINGKIEIIIIQYHQKKLIHTVTIEDEVILNQWVKGRF